MVVNNLTQKSYFIQESCFHPKTLVSFNNFQFLYVDTTGQSRDHMTPASKNRRVATHIPRRLEENFSNNNNEKATADLT